MQRQVEGVAEAEARFREAEQLQQLEYPLLYSMRGFLYCDLLIAAPERAAWQIILGGSRREEETFSPESQRLFASSPTLIAECRAISQRATQTIKIAERNNWLLDIALDHLTLGRAALCEAILERSGASVPQSVRAKQAKHVEFGASAALATARRELDSAVSGFRRAGGQDDLPRGLLARTWLRSFTGACTGPDSAQGDLDEAWEIAERGPMKLFMADVHLYRARLFLREPSYPWNSAAADLAAARKLIEQCGYWRRKEELEHAEDRLRQQA